MVLMSAREKQPDITYLLMLPQVRPGSDRAVVLTTSLQETEGQRSTFNISTEAQPLTTSRFGDTSVSSTNECQGGKEKMKREPID